MATAPPLHRTPLPSLEIRQACLALVLAAAEEHGIPPVLITCDFRDARVSEVRRQVQAAMVVQLGLKQWIVAWMFSRDVRRVRSSSLGIPASNYRGREKLVGKRCYPILPKLMMPV